MQDPITTELDALFESLLAEQGVDWALDTQRYSSIIELFETAVARYGDKPAFSSLGCTISFSQLERLSGYFASWVQHHTDLEPGDRFAVQTPNLIQYPVVVFGALRAGLVIVNTNPLYSAREIKHQFNDAGVKGMLLQANVAATTAVALPHTAVKYVVTTELADLHSPFKRLLINNVAKYLKKMVPSFVIPGALSLNSVLKLGQRQPPKPVNVGPDDLAMLQYTGGTTGVAKGAMLSHRNLVANALQAESMFATLGLTAEGFVIAQPLPLYHIYAFMTGLHSILSGAHMALIPNPRDLDSVVKVLTDYRPTVICGLNTLFVALCNHPGFRQLNFSALKATISGGMALTKAVADRWQDVTGCEIAEGYGLTETSPLVSCNPGGRKVIGTIGLPAPATRVKIVDDEGAVLPRGQAGELCVSGPQVMVGYWQRPDETAKVMDPQGYFCTGDVAVVREDGYLQIVDRKKDMIVVSGFNVYPNELEDVLYQHPDVVECAAVGVPDESSGEVVKVFVVSASGELTAEQVREFCRQSLTAYKVPKLVEFKDELPKTNVGKILRRELRDS